MIRPEFDAMRTRIRLETAGEWDIQPEQTVAGRVTRATLLYKDQFITSARCHEKSPQWIYDLLVLVWKAGINYAAADRDAA